MFCIIWSTPCTQKHNHSHAHTQQCTQRNYNNIFIQNIVVDNPSWFFKVKKSDFVLFYLLDLITMWTMYLDYSSTFVLLVSLMSTFFFLHFVVSTKCVTRHLHKVLAHVFVNINRGSMIFYSVHHQCRLVLQYFMITLILWLFVLHLYECQFFFSFCFY